MNVIKIHKYIYSYHNILNVSIYTLKHSVIVLKDFFFCNCTINLLIFQKYIVMIL